MRKFDLEAAKQGAEVVFVDGGTDIKDRGKYKFSYTGHDRAERHVFLMYGHVEWVCEVTDCSLSEVLKMTPQEKWINLYTGGPGRNYHENREAAIACVIEGPPMGRYIKTIKVEI